MKKTLILLSVAAVAAIACQKPVVPSVTAPSEVSIPQEGLGATFKVTSNVSWTAAVESSAKWVTIAPAEGGAGETVVKVAAEAFQEKDVREAKVVINAGGATCEVVLRQSGLPTVSVSPEGFEFGPAASSETLEIKSNTDIKITLSEDSKGWLEVNAVKTKALPTVTYQVSVKENPVYAVHGGARYGEISVRSEAADTTVTIPVYQNGISTSLFKGKLSDVVKLSPKVDVAGLDYGAMVSAAILGDKLIVCGGDGSAPTILDKKTGENKGKLNIGNIKCYSVANDDAGHLLISNRISYSPETSAYSGSWEVYYMSSTTDTPHNLINTESYPYGCVGAAITCRGDVTSDALIGAPTEFPGVTAVNEVTVATIKEGKLDGAPQNIGIKGHPGLSWAEGCWYTAPDNFPAFVFKSSNPADGALIGWYDNNGLWDVAASGDVTQNTTYTAISWAANLCAADFRDGWFAYIGGQFFPAWALKPEVYVYDPDAAQYVIPTSSNGEEQVCTTADIAIEKSEGGATIYYLDYNCDIIEGMYVPTRK